MCFIICGFEQSENSNFCTLVQKIFIEILSIALIRYIFANSSVQKHRIEHTVSLYNAALIAGARLAS